MNADERTPGQQGYGQQTSQDSDKSQGQGKQQGSQPLGQQQQQNETSQDQGGGAMSTGQASYGNSGETDTLSENSSSFGQDSDLGQGDGGSQSASDGKNGERLFGGSDDDLGSGGTQGSQGMPSGLGGGGYGASGQTTGQQDGTDQDFADQGQGALNEDMMGSDEDGGTTDIEVERSQGRESDIEGRGL